MSLTFSVTINAPKQTVWETMLNKETYIEWTHAFHPGSYYEGNWEEGSEIRFVAEDDGKLGGMLGKIVENRPYEKVSIEYLGEIKDGEVDTTSDEAKQWIGGHEDYTFTEENGVTTLHIELTAPSINKDMSDMFEEMWPTALAKLKELAERE